MTFSDTDKLKALAIVSIFETSQPLGDSSACVVLDDGAGISYGRFQFTHRSGSLASVVDFYLQNGGRIGAEALERALPALRRKSKASIAKLSADETLKKALMAAGVSREMKAAQNAVAFSLYLRPAIDICSRLSFRSALSLAVVYDSVVHGGWERIAARVSSSGRAVGPDPRERAWITDYVRKRHSWLIGLARLKPTAYRTRFFLAQIAIGNWDLRLPLDVHGTRLIELPGPESNADEPPTAAEPPAGMFEAAAAGFDRVDAAITGVITRTDRAKSLWATVAGTLSQAIWAVVGMSAKVPSYVWMTVAIIGGALTLLFLYRQIVLGRIRETAAG